MAFRHGGDWRRLGIAGRAATAVAQGGEVIMVGGVRCDENSSVTLILFLCKNTHNLLATCYVATC